MSGDLSGEITAIATAVLAVFAIVTAVFAILAFRKQSQEVRAIQRQVKDQEDEQLRSQAVEAARRRRSRGISSASSPAATQNSAPFRARASGDPRRQPDGLSGTVDLGHYLGTIAAFKLVSTRAPVSEITSSASAWMSVS